jgi:hypothetical protein
VRTESRTSALNLDSRIYKPKSSSWRAKRRSRLPERKGLQAPSLSRLRRGVALLLSQQTLLIGHLDCADLSPNASPRSATVGCVEEVSAGSVQLVHPRLLPRANRATMTVLVPTIRIKTRMWGFRMPPCRLTSPC